MLQRISEDIRGVIDIDMDKEEFLRRYNDGERDFSSIELRDVDLSDKSFYEIKLHRAKLINVNLSKTRLIEKLKNYPI